MQTAINLPEAKLFLIDAATSGAAHVTTVIDAMNGVIHVEAPSPYAEDPMYCQVVVLAGPELTEEEMDEMLHRTNADYIGVVQMTRH